MTKSLKVVGTLPSMIRNDEKLYEGSLVQYFRVLFNHAQNLWNPYHNFRHTMHVVWLTCCACRFYRSNLSPRQMRNILVAALFHDFDHPGTIGNDDLNVERAVRSFKKHMADMNKESSQDIIEIIRATEFPYKIETSALPLSCQIIRDADMGQCFSSAWIQQVILGLAKEWNKGIFETFQGQAIFLEKLNFYTQWDKETFPQQEIDAKRQEVSELTLLLE